MKITNLNRLFFTLSVITIFFSIFHTFNYYILIPQWDEYDVLDRFFSLKSIDFLMSQNNEHRTFVTNFLFIIDYYYLNGYGYLPRLSMFFILFYCCYDFYKISSINKPNQKGYNVKNFKYNQDKFSLLLIFFTSIILFSPTQFENFVRGFNNQVFFVACFNFLALTSFFKFVNNAKKEKINFYKSIFFSTLSTFSMVPGFFTWFLLLIFSLYNNKLNKIDYSYTLQICLFGLAIICLYFFNYQIPATTDLASISSLDNIIDLIIFQLIFLGNLGSFSNVTNIILAIISFGLLFFFFFLFISNKKFSSNIHMLMLLLCLNTILITQMNAFGRFFLGFDIASSSRYITFINFYWIAIFFLMNELRVLFKLNSIFIICLLLTTILIFSSFPYSHKAFKYEYNKFEAATKNILENDLMSDNLKNIHPVKTIRERVISRLKVEKKNIFNLHE